MRALALFFLIASTVLSLVAARPHVAVADDCSYSQEKYHAYLNACTGLDGCASKNQMQAMVSQTCGPASSDIPKTGVFRKPGKGLNPIKQTAFEGEACNFFTKPGVEHIDDVVRTNVWNENRQICYQEVMYQCVKKRWKNIGQCTDYPNWRNLTAEKLEKNAFDP